MKRILILAAVVMIALPLAASGQRKKQQQAPTDREYWAELAYRISQPILEPMSRGELQATMPMKFSPTWDNRDGDVAWMEAFGRLMAGIAPWLALPDDGTSEGAVRAQLKEWALRSYAHAVDPESPDYLGWRTKSPQVLVDAAYVANSFIRAPQALWEPLDEVTKQRYITEFRQLMRIPAWNNNWILFRAMIDAFFLLIGEEYDAHSLYLSVIQINDWYVGDGWYSDGPNFALDYYNSWVINPMMVEITEVMTEKKARLAITHDLALRRMQRFNVLLERLISPEATYPPIGRSITYRMAAFQSLALSAWRYGLPDRLTNGMVRNALTSVMKRMFAGDDNFDEKGYLILGFNGNQPDIADYYTNSGSLYITSLVFLPLGLSADHDFWTAPAEKWTSQRAWGGEPFQKDYHEAVVR